MRQVGFNIPNVERYALVEAIYESAKKGEPVRIK